MEDAGIMGAPGKQCFWASHRLCFCLILLPLECLIEGERTKCRELSLARSTMFSYFPSFLRFCFSSYSSSCQFLTMNSVVIQCGCSSECCMHNTTDGSNTSMSHRANHCVLFWQRSISGCFKYSEIKELPCIQLCVCVCARTYALCDVVHLCMSAGGGVYLRVSVN